MSEPSLLDGLRVVLLGSGSALSMFGSTLSDQGADVIRVEPRDGDEMRRRGPFVESGSLTWATAARGCRSVTCARDSAEGARLLWRLVESATVVGVVRDALPATEILGPRVIVQFDNEPELVAAARSGLLALTGDPDRAPVPFGVRLIEQLAGISAATAALAALLEPAQSGSVIIEVAAATAALRITEWTIPAYQRLGFVRRREGNRPSTVAPLGVYETKDGQLIAIVGGADANFQRLTIAMQQQELLDDERFTSSERRAENGEAINAIVEGWVAAHTALEVETACRAAGAPFGAVDPPSAVLRNPHFAARGDVVTVEDPLLGPHRQSASHPRVVGVATAAPLPAPALGQHNEAVWCDELGLSRTEFRRLRDAEVI